jgi:CubicO group peptidase (beta-lactamase class C family)
MKVMKVKYLIFLFISFLISDTVIAQTKEQLKEEIDKIIRWDTEIEFEKTPAFSIGIMDNDSTYFINYGNFSKEEKRSINEDAIFEIGSLSKPISASLVSLLVAEGHLSFDDALNIYIPENYRNEALNHLSIDDLLTHNSGLPRLPIGFGLKESSVKNPYQNYSKKDLLEFYKNFKPIKSRKSRYLYSHVNYALLEVILEQVMKIPFEEILHSKLLSLLRMSASAVYITSPKDFVQGYALSGRPTSPMDFRSFAASEGIKSSSSDLMKFVKATINEELDGTLNSNLVKKHKSNLNKHIYSARGWQIIDRKPYDIYFHSGKSKGHAAYMLFIKETKTAVVLLANSEKGTEDLAMLILRMLNKNWKRRA